MSRQRSTGLEVSARVSVNLKRKRKELGYSRQEIAGMLCVTPTVIRHIENGISEGTEKRRVRVISIDESVVIAETLGMSLEELCKEP